VTKVFALKVSSSEKESDKYYVNNFNDFKVDFVDSLCSNKIECTWLIKIISGCANTNQCLYRLGLIDSPKCMCDFEDQDLNYLF